VTRRPLVLIALIAALAVGGYLTWDQFLRGDNVPPLSLPSASPSSPSTTLDPSATPAGSMGTATADELAGEWTVADGTVVGYRVRERLASLSADSDAVGRTSSVTGSATLEASGDAVSVTAAAFEADLTTLTSDDGRRDRRIQEIGLESAQFPTATFALTSPVEVPAEALQGQVVNVTLVGDLTIHGVTKSVSIPAQAQLNGADIQVLGTLTFPFSDFGMAPPSIGGFVSVQDDATLEFVLVLSKV
jgi:polyisoprenoid-binding protein YceI